MDYHDSDEIEPFACVPSARLFPGWVDKLLMQLTLLFPRLQTGFQKNPKQYASLIILKAWPLSATLQRIRICALLKKPFGATDCICNLKNTVYLLPLFLMLSSFYEEQKKEGLIHRFHNRSSPRLTGYSQKGLSATQIWLPKYQLRSISARRWRAKSQSQTKTRRKGPPRTKLGIERSELPTVNAMTSCKCR